MRRQDKSFTKAIISLFLIALISGAVACRRGPVSKAPDAGPEAIYLQFAQFDPTKSTPAIPKGFEKINYSVEEKRQYLVQFKGPITENLKQSLVDKGGEPLTYIPNNTFIIKATLASYSAIQALPDVRWAGDMLPAYKVFPTLLDANTLSEADNPKRIRIQLYKDGNLKQTTATIQGQGNTILASEEGIYQDYIHVQLADSGPYAAIQQIASMPEVEWVEPLLKFEFLNDSSRWIIQSYVTNSTPLWTHGLSGQGTVVGVSDTGLDADNCYFYDSAQGLPNATVNPSQRKVIAYHDLAGTGDWDGHGHGTHTSGSIGGNNFNDSADSYNGMAPGAKIVMQDIGCGGSLCGLPADLNTLFLQAYNDGARIHSNSWGASVNSYDTYSMNVDQFMWNHKDFLILFSAGNSGSGTGTIGTPSTAKDLISSGAAQNSHPGYDPESIASFSSNGPAADGRIKPTVAAPGNYVNSARGDLNIGSFNCNTQQMSGTSMSCPTTAGLAALVRQYFTDGYYPSGAARPADGFVPSAALVKAVLVNSARNMTGAYTDGPRPATGQGWGEVKADDALYFTGDTNSLVVIDDSAGVTTGQTRAYSNWADGANPLKVTLIWTDYAATPSASVTLVNDLNLSVSGPSGTFIGNVFSGGSSTSGGTADNRNVEENVFINTPVAGTYTITVSAFNVPQGPQPFALVVTGVASCSSNGDLRLDKERYPLSGAANIRLSDCDLDANPSAPDTAVVSISSDTEPGGESVTVTETGDSSGVFEGSINLATGAPVADGKIQVADGNTITARYLDASPPATVIDTAVADGASPIISAVQGHPNASGTSASITWNTNESANSKVYYGTTPALGLTASSATFGLTHNMGLTGLTPSMTYYFDVESTDAVGNTKRDNNGGIHYTLSTAPPEIVVAPTNVSVTLHEGGQAISPITISNISAGADLTFSITDIDAGVPPTVFFDNMESGTNGWTHSIVYPGGITDTWAMSNVRSSSGSTSWHTGWEQYAQGSMALVSPSINITSLPSAELTFNHWYQYDDCGGDPTFEADGGIVEISINGGASWTQINPTGGYPYTLDDYCSNPLAYYNAYSHSSSGWQTAVFNISAYVGNVIKLRFHLGLDCGYCTQAELWYIDDVRVGGSVNDVIWLTENPSSGSVSATSSQIVNCNFDALDLAPGAYAADIYIANDDPDENPTLVDANMTIIPSARPEILSKVADDDSVGESTGDGDGFIEPGENIELVVTLKNQGSLAGSGLTGTLSSTHPEVTITDAFENFPNLPAGGTGSTIDDFGFTVSNAVLDGEVIPFQLVVTDGSLTWNLEFTLTVQNKSSIMGTVTSAATGAPIGGATVKATGPDTISTTSDLDGSYRIDGLTSGNYAVTCTASGQENGIPRNVTLPPDASGVNFSLDDLYSIDGIVVNSATMTTIPNAAVNYTGPDSGSKNTDGMGYFFIGDLSAGTYSLTVVIPGLPSPSPTVVVVPPTVSGLMIEVPSPLMAVSPPSLEVTIPPNSGTTRNLTLSNTGSLEGDFTVSENLPGATAIAANPGDTVKVLIYTQYADMSASGEYQNTLTAINQVATASGINFENTQMANYTQLASLLPGKDVLLIVEQETASVADMTTVGTAWATTLQTFVNNGGVVIQCDFANSAWNLLKSAGLMNITGYSSSNFMATVTVSSPSDPIVQGVASTYAAYNGSSSYIAGDGTAVVTYLGSPVVVNKNMGGGHVVLIGHDYYSSYSEQNKIVGNAVLRLPNLDVIPWLDEDPKTGTVLPSGTENIDVLFDSTGMAEGRYEAILRISTDDPANSEIDVPVAMTVANGAFIYVVSTALNDDSTAPSSGNGNGQAEPGEIIELAITARNSGIATANSVVGNLTTTDIYASIITGSQSYGTMAPGVSVISPSYVLGISPTTPDGHEIVLDVTFQDSALNTWTDSVTITVYRYPPFILDPSSLAGATFPGGSDTQFMDITNISAGNQNFIIEGAGSGAPVTLLNDQFPSTIIDTTKWLNSGAFISGTIPVNPPSTPYALDLQGQASIESKVFDTSGMGTITYAYSWERTGNGESIECGEFLFFEWWNGSAWVTEHQYGCTDGSTTSFTLATGTLPAGASHAGFKIRFRNSGTSGGFDDMLVDNVVLTSIPSGIPWLTISPETGAIGPGVTQTITATFNATGLTPGVYTGTITVKNTDPTARPIPVPVTFTVSNSPILFIKSYIIDDDNAGGSAGNGNGLLEPGETAELLVEIANYGGILGTGITGTLSISDPLINITDANEDFPDLNPMQTGFTLEDFDFSVDPAAPSYLAVFNLALFETGTGQTFNRPLTIPIVLTPEIDVSPPSVIIPVQEGNTALGSFSINNFGSANLTGSMNDSPDEPWLSIAPNIVSVAPGLNQSVQLTANPGTLGLGTYSTDVIITTNDVDESVLPVNVTMDVTPGSNLQIAGTVVDDDSAGSSNGDGDGFWEPGERIELGITLDNIGSLMAPGVTASLTSLNPQAVVLANNANYGDIGAFASATMFDFVLKVDTAAADGTAFPFSLAITTIDGRTFVRAFTLKITCSYEVTGTVMETLSGIPIGGAAINWTGPQTGSLTTAGDGSYTISSLPGGDYTLNVSKTGYTPRTVSIHFPPDHQTKDITLNGPVINVTPPSVSVTVPMDGTQMASSAITIADLGANALTYSVQLYDDTAVAAGGPDGYGYKFYDETGVGGPAPGFVDISSTGTLVPGMGDDTNVGPIDVGFDFPFYGQTFNTVYLCSNGWISFTDTSNTFIGRQLPDPTAPGNIIAPFWTDLDMSLGQVFYQADASGMVIEFLNAMGVLGDGPYTFEVVLTPGGAIRLEYQQTQAADTITVGIQNATGTNGLTVVHKQAYLHDGSSVLLAPGIFWLTESPASGTVASASTATLDLAFDVRGLNLSAREYNGRVEITSNDPEDSPWTVPVTMTLNRAPIIASLPVLTATENALYSYDVDATDPDGDTLIYSLETSPAGMTIDPASGVINWTPVWADIGDHPVSVLVGDPYGGQARQAYTLHVDFQDNDGDGLPDTWEISYGLDPSDPTGNNGADGDPDNDGLTNLQEYNLGYNPMQSNSPTAPSLNAPAEATEVTSLTPTLSVNNASDPDGHTLTYIFEIYLDAGLTLLVASDSGITEGGATTPWVLPLDLTDHTWYYWRARASDGLTIAPWMAPASFRVNRFNEAPGIPVISSPLDGGSVASLTPQLEVSETGDLDGDSLTYYLKLYADQAHTVLLESSAGIPQTGTGTIPWPVTTTLVENRWYYWTAGAVDEHSLAGGLVSSSFQVDVSNEPPYGLTIFYPLDGVELQTQTVPLVVNNARDPEGRPLAYQFQLDTAPDFTSPSLIDSGNVPEAQDMTSFTPPVLNDNTLYYWRARAIDGAITGYWVNGSFMVNLGNDPPSVPTPTDPPDLGTATMLTPTLTALQATDPDMDDLKYYFKVSSDSAMTQQVVASPPIDAAPGGVSWNVGIALDNHQTYYWNVWAVDEHNLAGASSATQSFAVDKANSPPRGIHAVSPRGGIIVGVVQPEFIVDNATDPDDDVLTYEIEVYADSQLTVQVLRQSGIDEDDSQTSWIPAQALQPGVSYFWRARAYDGALYSAWTSTATFVVSGGPPVSITNIYPQYVAPGGGNKDSKSGCVMATGDSPAAGFADALLMILTTCFVWFALRRRLRKS